VGKTLRETLVWVTVKVPTGLVETPATLGSASLASARLLTHLSRQARSIYYLAGSCFRKHIRFTRSTFSRTALPRILLPSAHTSTLESGISRRSAAIPRFRTHRRDSAQCACCALVYVISSRESALLKVFLGFQIIPGLQQSGVEILSWVTELIKRRRPREFSALVNTPLRRDTNTNTPTPASVTLRLSSSVVGTPLLGLVPYLLVCAPARTPQQAYLTEEGREPRKEKSGSAGLKQITRNIITPAARSIPHSRGLPAIPSCRTHCFAIQRGLFWQTSSPALQRSVLVARPSSNSLQQRGPSKTHPLCNIRTRVRDPHRLVENLSVLLFPLGRREDPGTGYSLRRGSDHDTGDVHVYYRKSPYNPGVPVAR
jgi:hypothetical protein